MTHGCLHVLGGVCRDVFILWKIIYAWVESEGDILVEDMVHFLYAQLWCKHYPPISTKHVQNKNQIILVFGLNNIMENSSSSPFLANQKRNQQYISFEDKTSATKSNWESKIGLRGKSFQKMGHVNSCSVLMEIWNRNGMYIHSKHWVKVWFMD